MAAAEEAIGDIAALYTYAGPDEAFSARWIAYSDERLVHAILRMGESRAARLMSALRKRRLPLRVLHLRLKDLATLYRGRVVDPAEQQEVEQQVANTCAVDTNLVAVDVTRSAPPRPSSAEPLIQPEEILVRPERGDPVRFHEVSDIFGANPLRAQEAVAVYVPLQGSTQRERVEERKRMWSVARRVIRQRETEVGNES